MKSPVTSAVISLGKIKERDATRSGSRFAGFYTLVLFGLVVVALMISLLFATTVYGAINTERVEGDENRAALNVIANSIRQTDAFEFAISKKGPQGNSLVLVEHTKNGNYETRYYLYKGMLLQEYTRESAPFNPEDAVQIANLNEFTFAIDDSLITVFTDKGQIEVAIRSQALSEPEEDDWEDGDYETGEGDEDTNGW